MCVSESIVQAYIDKELATEAMVSTRAHIDACSTCKVVVSEAITEQQMVSSALAHEMELPVPTVRLRARIEEVIKEGVRSIMVVPSDVRGTVIGVMSFYSTQLRCFSDGSS